MNQSKKCDVSLTELLSASPSSIAATKPEWRRLSEEDSAELELNDKRVSDVLDSDRFRKTDIQK